VKEKEFSTERSLQRGGGKGAILSPDREWAVGKKWDLRVSTTRGTPLLGKKEGKNRSKRTPDRKKGTRLDWGWNFLEKE